MPPQSDEQKPNFPNITSAPPPADVLPIRDSGTRPPKLNPTIIIKRSHLLGVLIAILLGTLTGIGLGIVAGVLPVDSFLVSSPGEGIDITSFIPAYIEVLAGLLIFGVTLPSILISVSPRMRELRKKHPLKLRIFGREIILGDSIRPSHAVVIVVGTIIILLSYVIPTPWFICSSSGIGIGCWTRNQLLNYSIIITTLLLLFNVLLVAHFFTVLRSYSKDQFLLDLERECNYYTNSTRVDLNAIILESISELGQYCEAGSDKDAVLETLFNLTKIPNVSRESRVKLAQSVREVVKGGDANNFRYALKILQKMYDTALDTVIPNHYDVTSSKKDNSLSVLNEFRISEILEELENVLVLAFSLKNTDVRTTMFETYGKIAFQTPPGYAYSFLRLGRAALASEDMDSAFTILGKFHTKITELLLEKNHDIKDLSEPHQASLHAFFGLVSYFWRKGNTARHIASQNIEIFTSEALDKYLQSAKSSHEHLGDIETADCLEQMLYENNQLQYLLQFLSKIKKVEQKEYQRIALHFPSLKDLRMADYESIRACGVTEAAAIALLQKLSTPAPEGGTAMIPTYPPNETFRGVNFKGIRIGVWKTNPPSS